MDNCFHVFTPPSVIFFDSDCNYLTILGGPFSVIPPTGILFMQFLKLIFNQKVKSVVEYKCEYTAITEQEDEYMIELIVSDMDGTLLNDKMEVSASNVSAIQRSK